jgi:hypothetical protein
MTGERGYAGQESDVNRACAAFGLDTVNYRAFPETGPVPAPPPAAPMPAAPMSPPQSPAPATPFGLLAQAIPGAAPPVGPLPAFSRARAPSPAPPTAPGLDLSSIFRRV